MEVFFQSQKVIKIVINWDNFSEVPNLSWIDLTLKSSLLFWIDSQGLAKKKFDKHVIIILFKITIYDQKWRKKKR